MRYMRYMRHMRYVRYVRYVRLRDVRLVVTPPPSLHKRERHSRLPTLTIQESKPRVGRVPENWALLLGAREERVEAMINMALRLQAHGRTPNDTFPSSVRRAAAEALGALRLATLVVIEAVINWQDQVKERLVKEVRSTHSNGKSCQNSHGVVAAR